VVEWAEKGTSALPEKNLVISLNYVPDSETERSIYLEPKGERYLELMEKLRSRLNQEKSWNWL
jgi:tRNA A37 threonylcarbamoyladenosine biosynthesis protein TsaE